ncbi:DNA-binding pseudobarrel domain superfamily [Forsythia ovata]|uniref:DNA-binding pseudobarrel domain superfamily n=1 Tax=Forsythia ovata TaxID=205694 RepID=A0ABD1UUX4_9LAMI
MIQSKDRELTEVLDELAKAKSLLAKLGVSGYTEIASICGWEHFVDHHTLENDFLLLFEYIGNSTFFVTISDDSSGERTYEGMGDEISTLGYTAFFSYTRSRTSRSSEDYKYAKDLALYIQPNRHLFSPTKSIICSLLEASPMQSLSTCGLSVENEKCMDDLVQASRAISRYKHGHMSEYLTNPFGICLVTLATKSQALTSTRPTTASSTNCPAHVQYQVASGNRPSVARVCIGGNIARDLSNFVWVI